MLFRADRFDVTVDFLLKQVAYLTERHASQVRAQVRKATAAAKGSAAPSPIPGSESAAGGNLRTASALSIRRDSPMPRNDGSTTATSLNTSARPNISRNTSANTAVLRDAGESSPKPGTRQLAIRPTEQVGRTRLSMMPVASPTTKSPDPRVAADLDRITSPGPTELSSATSSDDESSPAQSRIIRRPPRFQQQQEAYTAYQGDDDDESEPAFQPYRPNSNQTSAQDLSSTLRGDGRNTHKRGKQTASKDPIHYSHTSDSSAGSPAIIRRPSKSRDNRGTGPLSPRRTTEVRSPGGKSTKSGSRDGSDGTPSMGSSFSDLDGKLHTYHSYMLYTC